MTSRTVSRNDQEGLFSEEDLHSTGEQGKPLALRKNASAPQQKKPEPRVTAPKKKPKKRKRFTPKERQALVRFSIAFSAVLVVSLAVALVLRFAGLSYEQYISSDTVTNQEFVRSFASELQQQAMPYEVYTEIGDAGHLIYTIPYGTSVPAICRELSELGVLGARSAQELLDLLTANGFDTSIRSGTYLIPKGLDLQTIGLILYKGFSDLAVVSLYDGMTLAGIDSYLSGRGLISQGAFLEAAEQAAVQFDLPFAEGFCLPGTYVLPVSGEAPEELAEVMVRSVLDLLNAHADRLTFLGRTKEEILIIASMIQRETASIGQMPLISGIIYNRLDCGMPLGIDATTRYETDNWTRPITAAELAADTPYNTRTKSGLPPTGIANAGIEAIEAALFPDDTPYFYYLHDAEGRIHPAVTYGEHLENVEKYLR